MVEYEIECPHCGDKLKLNIHLEGIIQIDENGVVIMNTTSLGCTVLNYRENDNAKIWAYLKTAVGREDKISLPPPSSPDSKNKTYVAILNWKESTKQIDRDFHVSSIDNLGDGTLLEICNKKLKSIYRKDNGKWYKITQRKDTEPIDVILRYISDVPAEKK